MDLSAPSRRALTLLVSALVGSLAIASVIGVVAIGGEDTARTTRGRSATLSLTQEAGGVRALDVPLASLGSVPARRTTDGTVVDTGPIDTETFSMLGVTWQGGAADITARTRSASGWSRWRELAVLSDGPDRRTEEGVAGQRATDPTWVGASDGVQVRASSSSATDLRLALIEPDAEATTAYRTAPHRSRSPLRPRLHTRSDWGADDRLRSGTRTYNHTIKQVHVHHTVNSNGYARADVPGLIRGMYRYHTQNLGWSDIGYNFLVDRFGRIWVGRKGGARRNVQGAHTLGFNRASIGVAAIGNFDVQQPSHRVIGAYSRIAAWKLDKFDRHPRGHTRVTSTGSDRFSAGQRVRLPVIDGHRDTNETACPGRYLYERIPFIRRRAESRIERVQRHS